MKHNYYFSGVFALLRVFLISMSFVLAKKLDSNVSSMSILLIRSVFSFLLLTPIFIKQRTKIINTNRLGLHLLRGIFGSVAMFCIYYSTRRLPLALSSTIAMSLPLFITLLSCLILHESIKQKQWLLLILGYIGVTISLNPFQTSIVDSSILLGILANIFLSLSVIVTKTLSKLDSASKIMFYYNLVLVLVPTIFNRDINIDVSYNDMLMLFLIGLISACTQFFSIKSLSYSTPSFVAPFEYTRLVFAIPLGFIFFGEHTNVHTLVGAAIIIYSNIILAKIK